MAKKKKRNKGENNKPRYQIPNTMNVGGSFVGGNVDVENGEFIGRDHIENLESDTNTYFKKEFNNIYHQIDNLPETSKTERHFIKSMVEEVETEAQKGEQADAGFLAERLENIKIMAPDILEFVIATLVNPLAGIGLVMNKIQAKIEVDANGSSMENPA